MLIVVTSDIHAPLKLREFENSLNNIKKEPDYLLLGGDIIDSNQHYYLKKVYQIIRMYFPNTKIYSIFGNNEYFSFWDYYKKEYNFMNWLDDEYVDLGEYYLIGTEGILDLLTRWMKKNTPWIKEVWENRLKKIEEFIKKLDKPIIILSHYGLSYETVKGDPAIPSMLASKKFEELIKRYNEKIKYAFHGHSHLAKIWKAKIGNTEIYNVSFYIHRRPLIFEI